MLPWADFHDSTDKFIAPECLPDGFALKDPSTMVTADIDTLIGHWHKRSEVGVRPLEFKAYKTKGGNIIPCTMPAIPLDDLISMKELNESDVEGML